MTSKDIIKFWFEELTPEQWWVKDTKLDQEISERFLNVYQQASQGELFHWRETPHGRLAEVIVLDQFPRNIYRGDFRSFATDALALILAQEAVRTGDDQRLETEKRAFLYLPFMHSESRLIHEEAVKLFSQPGLEYNLDFEIRHKRIIDRFGRYPHRNEILGRKSTTEEIEFLKEPDSSF